MPLRYPQARILSQRSLEPPALLRRLACSAFFVRPPGHGPRALAPLLQTRRRLCSTVE
eukprot:CAMPEP_0173381250 /NCGR_PEP_ID=MMETSP1356-20130122/3663_1 /TAXON_ID=77927 ORGANISM="Hemiselmis virescens, Strain PCC157" /NCGR_SAMPLE_ID=MMETSP1356 /ASSEMBLY_ACC=CAM_ASM_000847 /LENGTH=57 /DNA_ID=CAMNT_0014335011 /DNA_START=1077 /DNA_END=1247 /DNA_ORIENTATION=-